MAKINIMDVEVNKLEDDKYQVWFVALVGEHGPKIEIPKSLLINLKEKIDNALKS